jgi:hypothetical protein
MPLPFPRYFIPLPTKSPAAGTIDISEKAADIQRSSLIYHNALAKSAIQPNLNPHDQALQRRPRPIESCVKYRVSYNYVCGDLDMYQTRQYRPESDITSYEVAMALPLVIESSGNNIVMLSQSRWDELDDEGIGRHFEPMDKNQKNSATAPI